MNNQSIEMPCPVCQTKIPIDTKALLTGSKFTCPNPQCEASIGLAAESRPLVNDAIEKLDEIKKNASEGTNS